MAAARNLRAFLSLSSVSAVTALTLSSSSIRSSVAHYFSPHIHPWRFLLLVVSVLLNAKSLPLVWHFRLFRSMFHQLYIQPTPLPVDALFRPIVTKSMYSTLNECDYNLHKSNSTYFADLDIARTQLISALLRKGIRASRSAVKGEYIVALGGVTCHFKREIKPYERYEIWTRILSWDRKWFYILSHIVKEGAVKPAEWALQPGKRNPNSTKGTNPSAEDMKKVVFATSIAKYVVKKSRVTIPPETSFMISGLLPTRPEEGTNGHVHDDHDPIEWTWDHVETERLRGMELAKHFDALDGLHNEYPVSHFGGAQKSESIEVLGSFRDLLW